MKTDPINPRRELIELSKLVTEALGTVRDGMAVDLNSLEERADNLCQYLLALPALEARPYASRLEKLIDGMNELEEAITAQFSKLMAQSGPATLSATK